MEKQIYEHKQYLGTFELLPETATNKYGELMRWIRNTNNNKVISVFDDKFKSEFTRIS